MRKLVLCVMLLAARPVWATPGDEPSTWMALITGFRQNLGAVGDRYSRGGILGIGAGWQPGIIGLAWSLSWSFCLTSDAINNTDTWLSIYELTFMTRARVPFRLGAAPAALFGEVGLGLFRTSIPVAPDDSRVYFGPTVGGGAQLALGTYLIQLVTDYGLFSGGPSGLKFMLYVGVGSR